MADFKHSSSKPESRSDSSVVHLPDDSDAPLTGHIESPMVGLPAKGPGAGIPANQRKIH